MTPRSPSLPGAVHTPNGLGLATRYRSLLTGLLLAVAAWALCLPSVRYGFVYYDDVRILRDHPELYGHPHLVDNLRAIFETSFPREEPLLVRDVTWAIDSQLFGFGNPFGYHLGNVLLHGLVVASVFAFLLGSTRRYGFALATSVAYLVLAVHTEPVASIMGRKDILSTLCMLLALCAQTRRLTTQSTAARCGWFTAALLCFVVALLSKISALTFPLVLFLHGVFLPYLRGERPPEAPIAAWRVLIREGLLLIPSLVASGLVYFWYQRNLTQMGIFDRGYSAKGLDHLWNLMMFNPPAFWVYLKQIFLPSHNTVLYTWPSVALVYPAWQIGASLLTLAAIGVAGTWLFRRRKDLFFYYGAFLALMIPYANFIYIGIIVADRYAYFPVLCILALASSMALNALRCPQPTLRIGALAGCLIFLGVNLFQKISYQTAWRDAETLWQYHIGLPQPSPTAFENLAAYYYSVAQKDPAQAGAPLAKMGIVVDAGFAQFWQDRKQPPPRQTYFLFFLKALIQEVQGDLKGALSSLLTSDRIHPRFDSTKLNLARLYRKLGEANDDVRQRAEYAQAARDCFDEYINLAFRGRPLPPAIARERDTIQTEYAALKRQMGDAPVKSQPTP
jgi:hypothetical protein